MKGNGKAVSFPLGRVLATPGALDRYGLQQLAHQFARHARGDWGDLDAHDRAANKGALQIGARIFSSYRMPDGEKLWIITEADRSSTTPCCPANTDPAQAGSSRPGTARCWG